MSAPLLTLEAFEDALRTSAWPLEWSWCPILIRLRPGQLPRFEALARESHITVRDPIDRQLADLALIRFPAASDDARRARYLDDLLSEHGGPASYGCWVYFPWESKVVHALDREAYFDVITNRNQDKITRDEQLLLRRKRVAVIGLSVGGEAAVTVAQEHLCGAIVLADFDRLDLSNLNRLNAGCDDLGEKKALIVARRIAKVNPYLEVSIFAEGVSLENLDEFLEGVDLVIEECDDLQMKYEIRRRAKARGVNMVFAADERGFLSVEPFASSADLPPFHGRIETPPQPRSAFRTPLEFMKALTEWMGGWDAISERSRRSLERLGITLCGYPQLASEARFAAGQIGHVARRLLLAERLPPFLGHLDLADVVPSETEIAAQSP